MSTPVGSTNHASEPSVVHLLVGGAVGGAERLVVDLAKLHTAEGIRSAIVVVTPSGDLASFVAASGLPHRILRVPREHGLAYLAQTFGRHANAFVTNAARDLGGNLLHLHTFGSHVLGVRVASALGIPVVRTEHDVAHYEDPSRNRFTRWAMRRTHAVIAISAFVERYLAANVREVPPLLRTVENGVSFERFRPGPFPSLDGPMRVLLVSRLHADKNPALALRAVAEVPHVTLTVLGEGSMRPHLEKLARKLKIDQRVSFRGHVQNPEAYIAEAEVVLSVTPRECFGLAVLEAQACARPVLATLGGAIEDVLSKGASLGVPASVAELAKGLRFLLRERPTLEARGQAARSSVLSRFPIERTRDGYVAVWREVLTRGPSPR